MQLPNNLREFDVPTLLVVTDNTQAKLYLVNGRSVTFAGQLSSDYPPRDSVERTSTATPAGMHSAEQSEKLKVVSRAKLYHELSDELMRRLQKQEFVRLALAAPEERLEDLKESLHIDLLKRTEQFLPKNLVGSDPIDIVMHFEAET